MLIEKKIKKEEKSIQEYSPEQDNNNEENREEVLEIGEDKENDEIFQKTHAKKKNSVEIEEEVGLPTLAISNEVNGEDNDIEKEEIQEIEEEFEKGEQIFNFNEIEETEEGEKKKKRKKKSKKKSIEDNIENSQEIKVEEMTENQKTVLEMITSEHVENENTLSLKFI